MKLYIILLMLCVSSVMAQEFPYPPGGGDGKGWTTSGWAIVPPSPYDSALVIRDDGSVRMLRTSTAIGFWLGSTNRLLDYGASGIYVPNGFWVSGIKLGGSGNFGPTYANDGMSNYLYGTKGTIVQGHLVVNATDANDHQTPHQLLVRGALKADTIIAPLRVVDSTGWVEIDSVEWRLVGDQLPETIGAVPHRFGWKEFEIITDMDIRSSTRTFEFDAVSDSANGVTITHIKYEINSRANVTSGTTIGDIYMNGGGSFRGVRATGGSPVVLGVGYNNEATYNKWWLRLYGGASIPTYTNVTIRVFYTIIAGSLSSYYVKLINL